MKTSSSMTPQKLNSISAAEATRKLQTKFPYLPSNIGSSFLRYVIPNSRTSKNIYFNVSTINYLMEKITAADKDTVEDFAVNKFIKDIQALNITLKQKRWYSVQDVALKVEHLKCNGKPHFGFETRKKAIDSVSNWIRAHQDKWFDETSDALERVEVPNNSKSDKILVSEKLMEKMFRAYLSKDSIDDGIRIPEDFNTERINTGKPCDDVVDDEPAFQFDIRGIKFLMKHSACTELLQKILANEPVDNIQIKDGFNITVSKDELAEFANSILKRL